MICFLLIEKNMVAVTQGGVKGKFYLPIEVGCIFKSVLD
jgi:hypothetical protein